MYYKIIELAIKIFNFFHDDALMLNKQLSVLNHGIKVIINVNFIRNLTKNRYV